MNCLLIILGESFRTGSQETRVRGNESAYPEQMEACNSHIKFIEHLNDKYNISTNVSLITYTTQYDNELREKYNNYLVKSEFYNEVIGLHNLFHKGYENIDTSKYDFIFYFRIDLFFKDLFLDVFNPSWNVIKFPSICWKKDSLVGDKPRVGDVMLFVPKKYFDYLNKIQLSHNVWYDLIVYHLLQNKDLGVMIDTFHDSDTEKDYNPIYYFVNRPRTDVWHSEGMIFTQPE